MKVLSEENILRNKFKTTGWIGGLRGGGRVGRGFCSCL